METIKEKGEKASNIEPATPTSPQKKSHEVELAKAELDKKK